jgi:glycosyltransferase involved in cell wall biosynthesis
VTCATAPHVMPDRIDLVLGTSVGGVGRHVQALTRALHNDNAEVHVHGPAATEDTFTFTAVGATFSAIEVPPSLAPLHSLRAVAALRTQLRPARLVHAHGVRAGLIAELATRVNRQRVAFVVTWHNVPSTAGLAALNRRLEGRLARRAAVSLVVSPDLVDQVRRLGGRDVRLAPVGAEPLPSPTRGPAAVRHELGVGDRPFVLAVGRLHRQKGFDVLIEAARDWTQRSPAPVIVIAGDGPQRRALAQAAAETAVDVRFLGYVAERARIAELLHAADLVVVPSRWEGSPLAVHEALMAGRPVIATAVGGLPTLLRPGEVAFVPADDAAALAQSVTDLLDRPEAAASMARAGAAAAARWPDADAAAREVIAVYDELRGS